jgi:prophage regulatory protein
VKLYFEKSELPDATTLAESTIDEEIRQGRFPRPRQLAGRRVGYLVEEVVEWARTRPVSDQLPPPNTGAKKPRPPAPAPQVGHQGA